MNLSISFDLSTIFAQMSALYPELRFGRLLEFIALLGSVELPETPPTMEDADLLKAARDHPIGRFRQPTGTPNREPVSETRRELLQVLQELYDRRPVRNFGQTATDLARQCGQSLYDVEDEQLSNGGRQSLEENLLVPVR